MCSFVQQCDELCNGLGPPCFAGPEDPARGLWVCNEDGSMTQWTSYPLWCCKDCLFGRGSCDSWVTNYGGAVHQALCPTEHAVQEDVDPGSRSCGQGICEGSYQCAGPGEQPECDGADPEPTEDCFDQLDNDCDGRTDCEESECHLPSEDCFNGIDDNCDELTDCEDPACQELPEICFDGVDDNCDPSDDDDPYLCFDPDDDPPNNGDDENGHGGPDEGGGPGKCDDCGACRGGPVHLRTRQMFVGPHEDVRVQSDNGGSFDLAFARVYDSDRAARDHDDDARPGVGAQHPFPRPFGPGWRHSYDDRLILRGAGAPDEPLSVLYDHAMGQVRLFPTGPRSFGRAPGRAIALEHDDNTWRLTLEGGDELLFAPSGEATLNHPWGASNPSEPEAGSQYHLRLLAIHPSGVPGYRIRVFHEQDEDLPAGICAELPGAACDSARGLLVAVAVEWRQGELWRRGASLHLRWRHIPALSGDIPHPHATNKSQYLLTAVVDGVDVDEGGANPEHLVDYRAAASPGALSWRQSLVEASSGLAGRADAPGALLTRIAYAAEAPWLLEEVAQPIIDHEGEIRVVPVERFSWEDHGHGIFLVGSHESQGVELAASQLPLGPEGVMSWTENGEQLTLRFDMGRPVECLAGDCGRFRTPKRLSPSIANSRYLLGVAVASRPDGSFLLRDFDEEGHAVLEAEVEASGSDQPRMTRTVSGDVEELGFVGVATVRRLTRSYITADEPGRVVAAATRASHQESEALLFPANAPASWSYTGNAAERPLVTHALTLGGERHYFDVDVSDADTDGDGKLNEPGEALVIWRHRSRTDQEGRNVYASERETRSASGQLLGQVSYGRPRSGGPVVFVGRTERAFAAISDDDPRRRGRLSSVTLFPNAGSGEGAFHGWLACGDAYDRFGRLVCRYDEERDAGDPNAGATVTTREQLEVLSNGMQRRTTTVRAAASGFVLPPATFEERLASGTLVASGTVGGNVSTFAVSGGALATQGARPDLQLLQDAAGRSLRRELTSFDRFGRATSMSVSAPNVPTEPRRSSVFSHDGEGRVERETSYADPNNLAGQATTTWSYGVGDDLLQRMTEPDGTELSYRYQAGRLVELRRDERVVAGYSYDAKARITEVRNALTPVSRQSYGADGAMVREENLAAGFVVEHEEDIALLGADAYRVLRTTHKSAPPDEAVERDLDTYYDNLGRVMMICDAVADPGCDRPLAEYVYGGKGGFAGVTTTASGRTLNLSDAFDHGRLSYVTHPAGATFFVYDAGGRVVTRVQHEGALPARAPLRSALLHAVDYRYDADGTLVEMRYPSNRLVQYLYGDDKRAPASVRVALETAAPQIPRVLVTDIEADMDGAPASWTWQAGNRTGRYRIERDGLGRITSMEASMTGRAAIDFGYTYAPDGDVTRQWDGSERSSLPGGVDEVLYDEHPYRDLLTRWRAYLPWTGASATDVTVTQVDELGRWRRAQSESSSPSRTVEVSFDYDASFPERLVRVRRLGGGPQPSRSTVASLGYDELGQVTSLAYGLPVRAQTLAYGPRGNVEVSTNASGVSEHLYSDTMDRWRRNGPVRGLSERFRYGVGGELLEDEQVRRAQRPRGAPLLRGRRVRDEFVYLGGRKIAAIHSGDGVRRASPPELTLLFADRLGTVRQVTTTDLRAVARIDTDAWGNGSVHDERGAAGPVRIPNIGERLPGQYADGGEPFAPVANGWRFYAPTLGAYLSPDPLYRASGMAPGAQAYAYAGGRPLVMTDPTGRMPGDGFGSVDEAAFDALQYATGLAETSGYAYTYGAANNVATLYREYGGCICKTCDDVYRATDFIESNYGVVAVNSIFMGWQCRSDRIVATFHAHPYLDPPTNPDDYNNVRAYGLEAGFVGGPDGTIWKYNGAGILATYPMAIDTQGFANRFRSGQLSRSAFIAMPGTAGP
ncbi:MAG: RHS repeat protein [Deltaproteobacteria bacterium]|nr:RHS repeat protein [Deltaproteobacteria bacterium]